MMLEKFHGEALDILCIKKTITEKNIPVNEYQAKCILDVLQHFKVNNHDAVAETLFKDVVHDYTSGGRGNVFEAMGYAWLRQQGISFTPQVQISQDDCLKRESYFADGVFNGAVGERIYFDIKSFGIGFPLLDTLQEKMQKDKRCENYRLLISGSMNISTPEFSKNYLERIDDLLDCLFSKPGPEESFAYRDDTIEIIAYSLQGYDIRGSSRSFHSYEWAQRNEFYFMYHGSQFCTTSPYIIICPFDKEHAFAFSSGDASEVDRSLRPLCRRMFIRLNQLTECKLTDYDPKAKSEISVSAASRKVSAILFIDVTKKYNYNNMRAWVYINPNADNKLHPYQICNFFRYNGVYVDDFEHDDY
jgi:hypothetical protein